MQESLKPMPAREMHKYVWGFVGVFFLIAGSFPISFWRVSQDQKFAGFHVKSLTDEGQLNLPSDTAVAVQTPASNPVTSNSASIAVQPANPADTMASSSNTNALAQPDKITDANQSTAIINPMIGNNSSQQIVANSNQVAANSTDPVQLSELNQKVYDQIAKDWQLGRRFEQSLVYRVSVTGDGAIASFQPVNQPASNFVQQTPLPNLLPSSESTNTPVIDFRVVFTSLGILEVTPWDRFGK
jgi:hypothetical protein